MTRCREDELLIRGLFAAPVGLLLGGLALKLAETLTPPPPVYITPPAQYRCFPEDVRHGVDVGMCPDARNQRMLEV